MIKLKLLILATILFSIGYMMNACTVLAPVEVNNGDDDDDNNDDDSDGKNCSPREAIPEMAAFNCVEFHMGDNFKKYDRDEIPVRLVELSSFRIDKNEVTNAEYADCVTSTVCGEPQSYDAAGITDYYLSPQNATYPVVNITWEDAEAYCEFRGKRLPTEAEWEYAARSGLDAKRYPWGDSFEGDEANLGADAGPMPVGSYAANDFGMYDMTGNVYEWVGDWYRSTYYSLRPVPDVDPYNEDPSEGKVYRGGSWRSSTDDGRVANREHDETSYYSDDIGIRCAD